jgi:hypothetical protein
MKELIIEILKIPSLAPAARRCRRQTGAMTSLAAVLMSSLQPAAAQDAAELAKKMSNPIAAVISLPFQFNWDRDIGTNRDGTRTTLNIQPVVPISLNDDWNLISRTIVPVVRQEIPGLGDGSQNGIGDVVQNFFLSPKKPGENGLIWGAGPVLLIPSSADYISADKWGLGPTVVALKVDGPMTYGVLANHIWSVGGSGKQDISSTFIQPFFTYTLKSATSFTIQTESTYDWKNEQWNLPIALTVGQILKLGDQPIQVVAGMRYYADSPASGPHGVAYRAALIFLFPK